MKIFLIYGEKDAGKTTTCQKILDWLNASGWSQISHAKIEDPADNWFNDFKVRGIYKDQNIAIYSPGDDYAHICEALSFGLQSPCCDVLIATVRKGIHYNKPLASVSNSPQHTITWFTLKKGVTLAEKTYLEKDIVEQITGKF